MKNENAMRKLSAALDAYPNPLDMSPGDSILEAAHPRLLERAKIALKVGHVDLGKDLGLARSSVEQHPDWAEVVGLMQRRERR